MSFQKIKRIFYREIYSKFKPLQYAKKIGVNFGSSYFVEAFCRAKKPGPPPFDLSLESESSNPEGVRARTKAFI